jgi:hypothetical protein
MTIFLNSYRPLIRYVEGQQAISAFHLPPYLDYSCRREPDFMSTYPSISALCRVKKFAPRLHEGDSAVYITCKGSYQGIKPSHWRLVAILEVLKRFESHADAAHWYSNQEIALPRNCMVEGNPPLPIELTASITEFGTDLRRWDLAYQLRARKCGVFLACKPQFLELYNPPIITEEIMCAAFNRIPGTQNPPTISRVEFEKLKGLYGIVDKL